MLLKLSCQSFRNIIGTVALRDIRHYQKIMDLSIKLMPFKRLIMEISHVREVGGSGPQVYWQASMIGAIHEAAEASSLANLSVSCLHLLDCSYFATMCVSGPILCPACEKIDSTGQWHTSCQQPSSWWVATYITRSSVLPKLLEWTAKLITRNM